MRKVGQLVDLIRKVQSVERIITETEWWTVERVVVFEPKPMNCVVLRGGHMGCGIEDQCACLWVKYGVTTVV